jgi:broad specificity phosphatase PhoE
MQLIVIRHGETDLNREDRLQGCIGPNPGLNELGREGVARLRDSLTVNPVHIYTSPLIRARETAQILNERFHTEVTVHEDLKERDFGSISGKLRSEVDPKLVEDDLEGSYDYRPFGGESAEEVCARVLRFLGSIPLSSNSVAIVVTHRGIIRILYDLYPDGVLPEMILPASEHLFEISELPKCN